MNTQPFLLYNEKTGTGSPILLLPGMLGTTRYWKKIISKLSQNHHIITMDLLGFGKSPQPKDGTYSTRQHTESIKKTLDTLDVDKPLVLVGHSMGSLLAVSFAKQYPTLVKRLILVSPPLFTSSVQARENTKRYSELPGWLLYGTLSWFTCKIFCSFLKPLTKKVNGIYFSTFRSIPKDIAEDALYHTWESYSKSLQHVIENQSAIQDLEALATPITVVYGENDKRVLKENIDKLKTLNKKIQIVSVSDAGHSLPIDHPEAVIGAIEG